MSVVGGGGQQANEIFAAMGEAVKGPRGEMLRKKFKGTAIFIISDTDKKYSLDLTSSTPSVRQVGMDDDNANSDAAQTKPDLTITVSTDDMMKLAKKEMNPQQAFMSGKLKIKGNMSLAMKLTSVLNATREFLPTSKL